MNMPRTRIETDSLGEMEIPADADYGIQTARAVENFPITGITLSQYPEFIQSRGPGEDHLPGWAADADVVHADATGVEPIR
jgi:hypothetical protein